MSAAGDTRARSLTHPPSERGPPSPARHVLHDVPKLLFTVTETSDPGSGDSVRRIGEAYGHTAFATRNAVTQNRLIAHRAEALKLRFIRLSYRHHVDAHGHVLRAGSSGQHRS